MCQLGGAGYGYGCFGVKMYSFEFLNVNLYIFIRAICSWKDWLGGTDEAILTGLSKTFDCILHNLLIAKLAAYGFDYQSLRIIESFLSNRQQRTKINNAFSCYSEITCGVLQGSTTFQHLCT